MARVAQALVGPRSEGLADVIDKAPDARQGGRRGGRIDSFGGAPQKASDQHHRAFGQLERAGAVKRPGHQQPVGEDDVRTDVAWQRRRPLRVGHRSQQSGRYFEVGACVAAAGVADSLD